MRALQDVDFTLREGEIHALMGENGAGKSTLIKVLTGVYPKDGGEVHISGIDGAAVIRSPQDAQNAGISTVYQEITLCPNLTVAENMYIGRTKGAMTNWKAMNGGAGKILQSLGIPASPNQQLGSCSIAVQQMVAIARAVDMECKVLILDEPTSSLDEQEVVKLFGLMRDLKAKGVGIIFVTHFLEQVYEVCDRITVLRDGQLVGEYIIEDLPRVQLVSKMLGKELDDMADIKGESDGGAVSLEGSPPSKMWINGLTSLQKPWCHFATQYNREIPNEEIDMDFMNLNQAAHGDREHGFLGARLRAPRKVIAGHWQDGAVRERIGSWMKAAVGVAVSKGLKVMRFGDNMREVAVTEGDKVEVQTRLGWQVNT